MNDYPTTAEIATTRQATEQWRSYCESLLEAVHVLREENAELKAERDKSRLQSDQGHDLLLECELYRDDIAALLDPYRTEGETDAEVVRNLAQVYIMASALTKPATLPVGVAELERLRDD